MKVLSNEAMIETPITEQEETENRTNHDIKSDRDGLEDHENIFLEKNVAQIEKVRQNVITEFEKKQKLLDFPKEKHCRKSQTENKINFKQRLDNMAANSSYAGTKII